MLGALEDLAAIGPLAFEHGARIVQPVGADMERRVAPGSELAVIPDDAIKPVIGSVGHGFPPCGSVRRRLSAAKIDVRLPFARCTFASRANTRYGRGPTESVTGERHYSARRNVGEGHDPSL